MHCIKLADSIEEICKIEALKETIRIVAFIAFALQYPTILVGFKKK
jgi:hypothetical protein